MSIPPPTGLAGARLDHVAVAVESWPDAWDRFVGELGGRWRSGGRQIGFAAAQIAYANDMRVEILEPNEVEVSDFLRRFLDKHGPGAHHLTFKVRDLESGLAALQTAGITPTGVDLSNAWWKEAFIYPRDAYGIVVQLAQAAGTWFVPPPPGVPVPPEGAPSASLAWVGHAVADIEGALRFFAGLLGAEARGDGMLDAGATRYADLAWPGPGRVRLYAPVPGREAASPFTDFVGDRPGRLHHIAFALGDPAASGARPLTPGSLDAAPVWELPPEPRTGVRVVLVGDDGR